MKIKELLPLILVVFLDLLGFGLVIPILPYFAERYGADAFSVGMIMTVYSLMQFIMAPIWGMLSDQFGRKKILLLSILGIGASHLYLSYAQTLEAVFLGRLLAGFFAANISVAYAYVADCTTESKRAQAMGLLGASFGLGFIFGPALGGVLAGSEQNFSFVFYSAALLSAFNLILGLILLREPQTTVEQRASNREKKWDLKKMKALAQNKKLLRPISFFFLTTLAVTQLEVTFALFLKSRFSYDAKEAGLLLALSGFVMVFTQGYLIRKLPSSLSRQKVMSAAAFTCILGLLVFAFSHSLILTILSLVLLGVGHGLIHPMLSSEVSIHAPSELRGFSMGWFHSASSLSRILGPLSAGFFYVSLSMESPYFLACLFLLPVVILNLVFHTQTEGKL